MECQMFKSIRSLNTTAPKWLYPVMRVGISLYLATMVAAVLVTQLNRVAIGANGKISSRHNLTITLLTVCIAVMPPLVAGITTSFTSVNRYRAKREGLLLMAIWEVPWAILAWKMQAPIVGSSGAFVLTVSSIIILISTWRVCHRFRWREPYH